MTKAEYEKELQNISDGYNEAIKTLANRYFNEGFKVGDLVREVGYPYTYVLDGFILKNNGNGRNPYIFEPLAIITPTKGQYFPHYESEGQAVSLDQIEKADAPHFNSKPERKVKSGKNTSVYLMFDSATSCFKIGYSLRPVEREATLQSEKPSISLVCYGKGDIALEKSLHERFAAKRVRGEWFRLTNSDVESIKNILK